MTARLFIRPHRTIALLSTLVLAIMFHVEQATAAFPGAAAKGTAAKATPAKNPAPKDLAPLIAAIKNVGPKGQGHKQAVAAARQLAMANDSHLFDILNGYDGANPLAANWLRGAFEAIAERQLQSGGQLPAAKLEQFVFAADRDDRARRLAYEWLRRVDPAAEDRIIPKMLDDTSLELRYDAVARLIKLTDQLKADKASPDRLLPGYRQAFDAARDPEQIKHLVGVLRELKQPVDLPTHLGFLMEWKLIGPFDNVDKRGYAIAYPPEEKLDFSQPLEGKKGPVEWIDHVTTDDYGVVDLNMALGKNMGAAAYAVAEFESDRPRTVDLRWGCINANKVWLNGKLLLEREVYHTGMDVDQYVAKGELKQGKNTILLKVCQNEQTDSWAQDWHFQLRVCDSRGKAILAVNRPPTKAKPAPPAETKTPAPAQ